MERRRNRTPWLAMPVIALSLGVIALLALRALGVGSPAELEAVSLARDQLALVRNLPWDALAPTDGFVPPPWIAVPGHAPGEVPVQLAGGAAVFAVTWSVAEADAGRREVEVRVVWDRGEAEESAERAVRVREVVERS